ncbi:MAG: hypothetical protein OXH68_07295 [Gammaproteobacteria bacterium]|nr:hypothetical protein [Gammaproteobacteria bacterium]
MNGQAAERDGDGEGRERRAGRQRVLKKWEYVPDVGRKQLPVKRLYRYMPVDACRRMVERGEVRVSSSDSFNDETLTQTRQDDEQTQSISASVSEVVGLGDAPKGFRVDVRTCPTMAK